MILPGNALTGRAKASTLHGKGNKGTGKKGDKGKGKVVIPTITKTPNDPKLAAAMQDLGTKHRNKTLAYDTIDSNAQTSSANARTSPKSGMRTQALRCNA